MKVIWNSLAFLRVQRVPDGLITTDQILQSTGIEISEIKVALLRLLTKMILVLSRYWIAIKQLQIKHYFKLP